MKKRFDIVVMGRQFSVLSDKGDEYVERIVQYVNERAREIGEASENATASDVAILVALNITEELFGVREEKEDLCNRFEGEVEDLIRYIDNKSTRIPCDVRDDL